MKRFNKRIPAFLMVMLVVLALTVPALAASASDAAPTAATTETEQTQQDNAAGSKSLAAGIAIGLAAAGGAIAMGVAVGKSTEGIARQPEAGKIRTTLMLGLVFIETAIIYALLVVILIIFVL